MAIGKGAVVGIALGVSGLAMLLLGKKAEAYPEDIVLSELLIPEGPFYIGETVQISLVATNIGEEQATKEIVCEVF